jgi:pimeloyl-ACP methyl ester carboxylesterase
MDGAAYGIEKPDNWNGVLVVYIHGGQQFITTVGVEDIPIRKYLISHGYAWAESSLDTNDLVTGTAARESAALVPLFTNLFSKPRYVLVFGASMGGGGAIVSAEKYAATYRGALALCPIAGVRAWYGSDLRFFVAAAFVAGVTDADLRRSGIDAIMHARIDPIASDPVKYRRLIDIWFELTGGPRPLAAEGFLERFNALGGLSSYEIANGLADNKDVRYELHGADGITDDEFNTAAIRFSATSAARSLQEPDVTGDIQIPVVSLSTTGDGLVPIGEEQTIRRRVDAAHRGDLLVQRTVQAAGHCELTDAEIESALEGLVSWIETGAKPSGEDLLAPDLTHLGAAFTTK